MSLRSWRGIVLTLLVTSWAGALLIAGWWVVLATTKLAPVEAVIASGTIREEEGGGFRAPVIVSLPLWLECPGGADGSWELSDLELFEDGAPLGPKRSSHDSIRTLGKGRHSHWGDRIIFSTSDGSDPRSNGRVYRMTVTPRPARWMQSMLLWLVIGAVLAGTALTRGAGGSFARWIPPIAFASAVVMVLTIWNLVVLRMVPSWVAVQADSTGYLGHYAIRTMGYPLMLRALAALTGDLHALVGVQVNLLILALVFLAFVVAVVVGTTREHLRQRGKDAASAHARPAWAVGAILLLFVGTSTRVVESSFAVMADGPFTAMVCAVAGCLGLAAIRRSWLLAALTGLAVALAALIKPAGLGLFPVLFLPWWWHRRADVDGANVSGWRAALTLLAPALIAAAVPLTAASLWNHAKRDSFGLSTMGPISLAGHVGWMISPQTVPGEPEIAARVEARLAPLIARRPELAWPLDYYAYTSEEYNELLYYNLLPEVDSWMAERGTPADERPHERARVLRELATAPIIRRPGAYARHATAHLVGATTWLGRTGWLLPTLAKGPGAKLEYLAALSEEDRALFTAWIKPLESAWDDSDLLPWERVRQKIDDRSRIYAAVATVATMLGLALLPWSGRRVDDGTRLMTRLSASPSARLLGALAAMAWGSLLLIALSATMIFRYVDALDPLFSAAILIAAVTSWQSVREFVRTRARPPNRGQPTRAVGRR